MLTLSGMIAIAGVLADSTATVIGAMIIAPLGTPILGIALGIVTGHLSLVIRSILWVLIGLVIVVVLGLVFSVFVATPESLATNSQVVGRTSPSLMDLIAALATGFAGGFAMCRHDLSAVLPGVAIAISLVPPLGVVGGAPVRACGATRSGRSSSSSRTSSPSSSPAASSSRWAATRATRARRRSRTGAARTPSSRCSRSSSRCRSRPTRSCRSRSRGGASTIQETAVTWLDGQDGARVYDVEWSGLTATLDVTTDDGSVPPIDDSAKLSPPSFRALSVS